MQVRDAIYAFSLDWPKSTTYTDMQPKPGSPAEPINVVVVETSEVSILFGTGDETTADELIPIARDHDVEIVVVEHGDPDHYEGVPYLRDALAVDIAIPAGDATLLEDEGIHPDIRLEAGESYWGIETIGAPGHTPDNMAYLYDNVLIAGDTVFGRDSVFAREFDWSGRLAVVLPFWNSDDGLAHQSVAGLLDYEFDVVLVTHGSHVLDGGYREVQVLVDDLASL